MRIASKVKVAVLTILLVYPVTAGAQTVTSADAQAFMGTWVINFNTPGGPLTANLTVKEVAGEVTAEIGGGANPPSMISEITKNGSSLVMQYEANVPVAGGVTPITLTVEADGDTLTASFDVAGQVLPGTGTRK